ncbi:riboflavin biosynthesis protein PYRD, chloroplastic-like [Nicotiana tabacum]|uniref:Riboflavin biosynthesis protein PYRD, chloroplastic n=2 Tax=Nicotiana TaxID=4085 RepID=A0A1S4BMA7_TOBAC|nr:PREDICTED: riboflavin biosynthesis protein PYRD, chloroplastic [Nicotiana sylvestris]XP_016489980.1 PREDICTED: riboflavin biosynthesis protein PYRD, chloroplastic-like [Nicotiana tabacum]
MYCCPFSPSKQSLYPSAPKNQPKDLIFASRTSYYGCCNANKRVSKDLVFTSRLNVYGFSNAAKRVSISLISLGNGDRLVKVRCGGSHKNDEFYIRRGVEIAKKAVGHTSPNPMVGCVIVKNGEIVGEGFHPKAGQPHAEVFALRDAGDLAENATAYVTLEPCNHFGRTPPCTEALINAKVKKVVVGMVDPNPIVASTGLSRLRDAGIEVITGVEEELCRKLNEAYIHQMLTGKPFVTLRYSLSVDGEFSNQLGAEVMESGGYYSKLLQEYDAVIVSSFLQSQNYSVLSSKEPGAKQPLQIVLAKSSDSLQLPAVTDDTSSKTIIFSDKEITVELEASQRGIETVVLDRMNLTAILEHCKRQGMYSVMLDLRGNFVDFEEILQEGFEQNLFQKVIVEVLPILGGSGKEAIKHMQQNRRLKNLTSRTLGESILLEGYF